MFGHSGEILSILVTLIVLWVQACAECEFSIVIVL